MASWNWWLTHDIELNQLIDLGNFSSAYSFIPIKQEISFLEIDCSRDEKTWSPGVHGAALHHYTGTVRRRLPAPSATVRGLPRIGHRPRHRHGAAHQEDPWHRVAAQHSSHQFIKRISDFWPNKIGMVKTKILIEYGNHMSRKGWVIIEKKLRPFKVHRKKKIIFHSPNFRNKIYTDDVYDPILLVVEYRLNERLSVF